MHKIANDKKQFIDDHFHEGSNLDKNIFDRISSSIELHYLADQHNWDNDVEVLQWIVESEHCSEATALLIFWRAQPQEFTIFDWNAKKISSNFDFDIFQLIKTIVPHFKSGFYKKDTEISYSPASDRSTSEEDIPAMMRLATHGQEAIVYYDKVEVNSWFGEYLNSKINSCAIHEDLFNIAYFVRDPESAKLILAHPLCDKGIAVLVFWRLKTSGIIWHEADAITKEIVRKINNHEYSEVLRYDPSTDTTIETQKAKWRIPEIMMRPV